MKIEEVTSLEHAQRVASHSHIKGLGLLPDGTAKDTHMGMVSRLTPWESTRIYTATYPRLFPTKRSTDMNSPFNRMCYPLHQQQATVARH